MKRGIFGLALLAVFLFTGLWSAGAMKRFHMPLSDRLEQAAQTALAGDLQAAAREAMAVRDQWDQRRGQVAILANHTPMDQVDTTFSRLEAYARAGNAGDFAALCKDLAAQLSATAEAHQLSWRNLL